MKSFCALWACFGLLVAANAARAQQSAFSLEPDFAAAVNSAGPINLEPVTRQTDGGSPSIGPNSSATMATYSTRGGFFAGIGGSYNSIKLHQDVEAAGTANIYSGGTLIAFGQAGGPANPFIETHTTFAPTVQLGYFNDRPDSNWIFGAKSTYRYLGQTFSQDGINVPQYGSFTNLGPAPPNTTFTGHVIINSVQTSIDHQVDLLPFIGYSFNDSYIYLGAGPTLFGTTSSVYQATGYADLNGTHYSITGTSSSFNNSKWMIGGAVQTGLVYHLGDSWFVDMSYEFVATGASTNKNSGPFSTQVSGYTDTGTLYVNTTQRLTVQSLNFSLNFAF